MISEITKKNKKKLRIIRLIDFIFCYGPVIVLILISMFSKKVETIGKVAILVTLFMALIVGVVNIFTHSRLRSPIWICLIGLYIAVNNWLLAFIIVMVITTVVDDFILSPLMDHYKSKVLTNESIDERLEEISQNGN